MRGFFRRFTSLRFCILAIVLMCWLVPTLLLGVYMGRPLIGTLQEKTEALLMTKAQQAQVRTAENIETVITLAKDVVYDDQLASAVSDFEKGAITYENYYSDCRSYLEHKFGRERLIDFAFFFRWRNPSTIFFTSDDYAEAVNFQQQQGLLSRVLMMSDALDTDTRFFLNDEKIYLVRNLFNTKLEKYGMLVLGLNKESLLAPVDEMCGDMDVTYMLHLDQLTLGNESYLSADTGMMRDGNALLYTLMYSTRDYTMRFQVQADTREVYREMNDFGRLMMGMAFLILPLCLLMMLFVNRRIVRPIRLLSEASARIRDGELGVTVPMRGNDELGQLGSAFSSMSVQLEYLVDKSLKEEIALRDARIQALQSRVNSHFLNNALETINWEARMEGSKTICEMVEALSCLLNAAMDRNERHLAPLKDELLVADAYFIFINLRFGEKLTLWENISEGLGDVLVPRLVIQTLVENAIEHGIAPMGGGRISLTIYQKDERLTVEVLNSGKKLSEEDIARIRRLISDEEDPQGHMGIRNVSRRLRLLYGSNASLTIQRDEHGQTIAAFTIPVTYEEKQSEQEKDAKH